MNVSDRFWSKVQKTDGCWIWTRSRTNGYGSFKVAGKNVPAHRWAYTDAYGPISDGLTVDHVCHNQDPTCRGGNSCPHRACVRPDHLEAVGLGANIVNSGSTLAGINARKETCPLGHPLTPRGRDGRARYCAECTNEQERERMNQRRRAAGIPVGSGVHHAMKTHCPQGHEYTPENTRTYNGSRYCRTCEKLREVGRWQRRKAARA